MDKEQRKKLKIERKQRKKKIKQAFKHRKGTFTWSEVEEVLED